MNIELTQGEGAGVLVPCFAETTVFFRAWPASGEMIAYMAIPTIPNTASIISSISNPNTNTIPS